MSHGWYIKEVHRFVFTKQANYFTKHPLKTVILSAIYLSVAINYQKDLQYTVTKYMFKPTVKFAVACKIAHLQQSIF